MSVKTVQFDLSDGRSLIEWSSSRYLVILFSVLLIFGYSFQVLTPGNGSLGQASTPTTLRHQDTPPGLSSVVGSTVNHGVTCRAVYPAVIFHVTCQFVVVSCWQSVVPLMCHSVLCYIGGVAMSIYRAFNLCHGVLCYSILSVMSCHSVPCWRAPPVGWKTIPGKKAGMLEIHMLNTIAKKYKKTNSLKNLKFCFSK